jgi:electron transport complex protein RnfG
MEKKKSNIFLNTLVLVVVTVVAIALLAIVNQITAQPIAQAEANAKVEVYRAVYPDANSFVEIDGADDMLSSISPVLASNGLSGCSVNEVLAVENSSNQQEGYVISATSPNGYGGDVQIAIGIKDGKLTGFSSVSNSETAGLGSKCSDEEFTQQFVGKPVSILTYTKTGASLDTEIDAISGATITTNAVTEATNSAILFYQTYLADTANN